MLRKYMASAFMGVKSARLRSFLTILGITMGIFMVITLLAVGRGAQEDVITRITDLGANIITVQASGKESSQTQTGFPTSLVNSLAPATLTLDDLDTVKDQQNITLAAPARYGAGKLTNGKTQVEPGFVIMTTQQYAELRDITFTSGRLFKDSSQSGDIPEIIIGESVKQGLFGNDDPIGKTIVYEKQEVRVSGVIAPNSGSEQTDRTMIAPLGLITDPEQRNLYSYIFARVQDSDQVDPAITAIKRQMASYRPESSFSVTSSKELLNASKNVLKVLTAMIGVVAAISLTMSGVGIMNMMVVSVTDRTKEIGVRKTVGASASNIFWQFLFEAVLLTAVGGLAGLALASAAVLLISKLLPIAPLLSADLVILGLGLSVMVGVLFGVGPAMRAARKEPIEALQTDRS